MAANELIERPGDWTPRVCSRCWGRIEGPARRLVDELGAVKYEHIECRERPLPACEGRVIGEARAAE